MKNIIKTGLIALLGFVPINSNAQDLNPIKSSYNENIANQFLGFIEDKNNLYRTFSKKEDYNLNTKENEFYVNIGQRWIHPETIALEINGKNFIDNNGDGVLDKYGKGKTPLGYPSGKPITNKNLKKQEKLQDKFTSALIEIMETEKRIYAQSNKYTQMSKHNL